MGDTVRRVRAVELAEETGVDDRQYRRKLREAAARGHIAHIRTNDGQSAPGAMSMGCSCPCSEARRV